MAEHDNAYKAIFSHAAMVEGLLRDFVHEDWVARIDFATLEKASGSYVADDLRDREDDIVWRVRLADDWLYVYLLIEFQSTVDPWMALRVMVYVGLLYQDLVKSGCVKRGERLPPVFPLVLYHGEGRWSAVRDVAELITPVPNSLAGYRPRLRYFLLDEGAIPEAELSQADSLAAELIRLETSDIPEPARRIIERLAIRLQAPQHDSLRRALTVWIHRVLLKRLAPREDIPELTDLQEINTMLAERAERWVENLRRDALLQGRQEGLQEGRQEGRQQGRQEGRKEGRKEGRQEGESLLLQKQLERRFGPLPEPVRERLIQATPEQLEAWGLRLLEAAGLDEVFLAH